MILSFCCLICFLVSKFRISYTPKSGTCVVTCVKSKSNLEAKIQEVERAGNMRLIFSYMDMVKATNNFDPLLILGQGGFGRVYRGYIDSIDQVFSSFFVCSLSNFTKKVFFL